MSLLNNYHRKTLLLRTWHFFNTVGLSFSDRLLEADIPAGRARAHTSYSFEYDHEIFIYEYCGNWLEGGLRSLLVKLCILIDSEPLDGNLRRRGHRRGRTQRYSATSRVAHRRRDGQYLSGSPLEFARKTAGRAIFTARLQLLNLCCSSHPFHYLGNLFFFPPPLFSRCNSDPNYLCRQLFPVPLR